MARSLERMSKETASLELSQQDNKKWCEKLSQLAASTLCRHFAAKFYTALRLALRQLIHEHVWDEAKQRLVFNDVTLYAGSPALKPEPLSKGWFSRGELVDEEERLELLEYISGSVACTATP